MKDSNQVNDMALIIEGQAELPAILDERAVRIRGLVAVARHSIIEIGRELIAAKAECGGHGKWLEWLKDEFRWTQQTATSYMRVADSFGSKSKSLFDSEKATITSEALYALASPRVPQEVRDEALDRAEAGERITKAEANEMIRKALQAEATRNQDLVQQAEAKAASILRQSSEREKEAMRQVDERIDRIRNQAEEREKSLLERKAEREKQLMSELTAARQDQEDNDQQIKEAIAEATKSLADDKKALADKLSEIETAADFDARKAAKVIENLELELETERSTKQDLPRYGTIVIDPPWPMKKIDREVRPNQVDFDYPTMSEEELAAFPVRYMADEDCHLFCWTTQKFLPMTISLFGQWGFKYVLTMVWHKPGGFQPIGLPQYNCEFVVYGRKGAPKFEDTKAFPVCFEAPRREHSRKPDEFYDLIRRVTGGSRIDVFSREVRDGFAQFGNEVGKF